LIEAEASGMPLLTLIEVDRSSDREFIPPHAQAGVVVGPSGVTSCRSHESVPSNQIGSGKVPAQLERLDVHICETPRLIAHVKCWQRELGIKDRQSNR